MKKSLAFSAFFFLLICWCLSKTTSLASKMHVCAITPSELSYPSMIDFLETEFSCPLCSLQGHSEEFFEKLPESGALGSPSSCLNLTCEFVSLLLTFLGLDLNFTDLSLKNFRWFTQRERKVFSSFFGRISHGSSENGVVSSCSCSKRRSQLNFGSQT